MDRNSNSSQDTTNGWGGEKKKTVLATSFQWCGATRRIWLATSLISLLLQQHRRVDTRKVRKKEREKLNRRKRSDRHHSPPLIVIIIIKRRRRRRFLGSSFCFLYFYFCFFFSFHLGLVASVMVQPVVRPVHPKRMFHSIAEL